MVRRASCFVKMYERTLDTHKTPSGLHPRSAAAWCKSPIPCVRTLDTSHRLWRVRVTPPLARRLSSRLGFAPRRRD